MQFKSAVNVFGKQRQALSGKVGGMKDDICIALQLGAAGLADLYIGFVTQAAGLEYYYGHLHEAEEAEEEEEEGGGGGGGVGKDDFDAFCRPGGVSLKTEGAFLAMEAAPPQWLHILWVLPSTFIGIVFILHPQMTLFASRVHVYLGVCLFLGPAFFCATRITGFKLDWPFLCIEGTAIFFYGCAILILMMFREDHERMRRGLATDCQPSFGCTVLFSFVSCCIIVLVSGLLVSKWMFSLCGNKFSERREERRGVGQRPPSGLSL
jgi:hypothetical protein